MAPSNPTPNASAIPKPSLKILMLHGYTQSGSSFYLKTRALQKHIQKYLPEYDVTFKCPSGTVKLELEDIPQYNPSQEGASELYQDCYGWWLASPRPNLNLRGMDRSLEYLFRFCEEEGPFDGVIGFSQGACIAALLASLYEKDRKSAFDYFEQQSSGKDLSEQSIPYPRASAPAETKQGPFKFVVSYSGFAVPGPKFQAFYSHPKITTPILHFYGTLDTLVSEERIRTLVNACEGDPEKAGRVVTHPGGHTVPFKRPFMDKTVDFLKELIQP